MSSKKYECGHQTRMSEYEDLSLMEKPSFRNWKYSNPIKCYRCWKIGTELK